MTQQGCSTQTSEYVKNMSLSQTMRKQPDEILTNRTRDSPVRVHQHKSQNMLPICPTTPHRANNSHFLAIDEEWAWEK